MQFARSARHLRVNSPLRRRITGAADVWASYGQTTAMEAGLGLGNDDIGIVLNAIDKKLLTIDLYIAAKDSALDDTLAAAYQSARSTIRKPAAWSRNFAQAALTSIIAMSIASALAA
jgi:hypothetical protein